MLLFCYRNPPDKRFRAAIVPHTCQCATRLCGWLFCVCDDWAQVFYCIEWKDWFTHKKWKQKRHLPKELETNESGKCTLGTFLFPSNLFWETLHWKFILHMCEQRRLPSQNQTNVCGNNVIAVHVSSSGWKDYHPILWDFRVKTQDKEQALVMSESWGRQGIFFLPRICSSVMRVNETRSCESPQ